VTFGDDDGSNVGTEEKTRVTLTDRTEGSTDRQDLAVLRPKGSLDAETVSRFREQAAAFVGLPRVVIDLSEVPFIDSTGLGGLIGAIRRVRERDGRVVVSAPGRPVARLLEVVGLDRLVRIHDALPAAVADLSEWEDPPA